MIKALGMNDGPKTKSEVDIMEWFAVLGEDEDMDADGCGALFGTIPFLFIKTSLDALAVGITCLASCNYFGCSNLCNQLYNQRRNDKSWMINDIKSC